MTTVAFIGLGVMGAPMAANILGAGFDVVGYNRSRPAVDTLLSLGGRGASSVEEAVADADVVATMLPDTPDVVSVMTGQGGVFDHAREGALIIDFSTIRPGAWRALAEQGIAAGHGMLDAPVSGGERGAISGGLSVMVGGAPEHFDAAAGVTGAVGKTVVHVGAAGAGQTVKAANQLVVAGNLICLAEALLFLEAHDVDVQASVRVLSAGLAGSAVLDQKASNMLAREFVPGFRVELHHKDMGIATAAAREAEVAIPLGALSAQLLGALRAGGSGHLDHSAVLLLLELLSGPSD